jgi:para-nitrobenzyl esterase
LNLEVITENGRIRGRERRGISLFAGIPYAAPPVGDLRFAPPQPAQDWDGTLDATKFGPAAPQLPGDGLTNAQPIQWDEDCLTLNVCTPLADDHKRPVMVWIHGGAFQNGTGAIPWYDGTRFSAEGDIVVVTINYRLGALGFARIGEAENSGINGILDQLAALQWVHRNITYFGGDPDQVTIAGESAGAFSVATLMTMAPDGDLFQRAIAQSGAGHHVITTNEATQAAERLKNSLGATTLRELRELSAEEILAAQRKVEEQATEFMLAGQIPFYPSITKGGLLPNRPIDLFEIGVGAKIALLTGTNADETALWGTNNIPEEKLERWFQNYVADTTPMIEAVKKDRPQASPGEIAMALSTDHTFRIPAIRMAESREKHGGKTWMYEFDWKSKAFGGALGACHALEIPFAFGTLDAEGADLFLGTDKTPNALGDIMHHAWTAFIRTGTPTTEAIEDWPLYQSTTRNVLRFADTTGLVKDPWPESRKSWQGIR